jgi:hypothetical protein
MRSTFERGNTGGICAAFRYTSRRFFRKPKPAWILLLMSMASAALCVSHAAQANQVIATVTGTLNYGTNRSGAFGFAPGTSQMPCRRLPSPPCRCLQKLHRLSPPEGV